MTRTLARIKKITITENLPPDGSVAVGTTPDGKVLYKHVSDRVRAVPKLDANGNREYAKNPMTAEPLYPKNAPEFYKLERLFYLEDQGNGNNSLVPYYPPSDEELAKEVRTLKVKAMEGKLAEALVDHGIGPDELLAGLAKIKAGGGIEGANPAPVASVPTLELVEIPEPEHLGAGWYRLSNGDKFRGTKDDAFDAEKRLQEAKILAGQQGGF